MIDEEITIKIAKLEIDKDNYFATVTLRCYTEPIPEPKIGLEGRVINQAAIDAAEAEGWNRKLKIEFRNQPVTMEKIVEQAKPILRRDLITFRNIGSLKADFANGRPYIVQIKE